jgi:hypothetical protein
MQCKPWASPNAAIPIRPTVPDRTFIFFKSASNRFVRQIEARGTWTRPWLALVRYCMISEFAGRVRRGTNRREDGIEKTECIPRVLSAWTALEGEIG